MSDYTELRAALEGATPGPWRLSGKQSIRGPQGEYLLKANWMNGQANATFVVSADPATIRALLAENERLRAELDGLRQAMQDAVAAGRPV